jgi:decaprenyl-phosphate phosphoribosyltransferase
MAEEMTAASVGRAWWDYVRIARPNHRIKSIFMLPGAAIAMVLAGGPVTPGMIGAVVAALLALCLIASANYTINEYLDAR